MNKQEQRKQEEMENNMEHFCEFHSDMRLKEWQENNKNVIIKPGDHIKVGFPARHPQSHEDDPLTKEWMWIEVHSVKPDKIIGKLDNEPVYITKPKMNYRDIVITFRDEIADHISETWKPGV